MHEHNTIYSICIFIYVYLFLYISGIESMFIHIGELIIKRIEQQSESNFDDYNDNKISSDHVTLEEKLHSESYHKAGCCSS